MRWPFTERLYRMREGSSELYLERYMLLPRNKFFNVFLHRFWADDLEGFHDHPCDWLLIGLRGWYFEQRFGVTHLRRAGRVRFMPAETFHRITLPRYLFGKVWTLAIRGPNRKTWGFLDRGLENGWTRWTGVALRNRENNAL